MCEPHWQVLSMETRRAVHKAFRPGQQSDGRISLDYLKAANAARYEVAIHELFPPARLRRIKRSQKLAEKLLAKQEIGRLRTEFGLKDKVSP